MAEWQFLLDGDVDPKVATYLGKEDLDAVHVRDVLGQGVDDEAEILPFVREHGLIIVTSDVKAFGDLPSEAHAGVILLYDDTMPPYRIASAQCIPGYCSSRVGPIHRQIGSLVSSIRRWG